EFTYDALGRRLSKSFGTTVTRWVWNGNVPLHQWKQHREYSVVEDRWNTDTERRDMTVWLFDEESFVPVAMIKEGRSYSILTDQLGTPTEAYDTEGNEVWSRVLDMDGNVIEETGNKGMVPFLFQGQYYDRETGLAYNRFRYYSPQMGMYVSQDPIRLEGGILNLYGYVSNTNLWIDVFGLKSYNATNKGHDYENRIRKIYGDKPFRQRIFRIEKSGKSVKKVADNVTSVDGKSVAIEAKYVEDWAKSIRNPNSPIGNKPFAVAEQQNMIEQAKDYSAAFDEVIYHTNSPELKEYYTRIFKSSGLDNVTIILTP
uniref:RHS repeat domain-containing protein n=2 Tax=Bacteroides ovatus TaxID=28116 RepID=UPI0035644A92